MSKKVIELDERVYELLMKVWMRYIDDYPTLDEFVEDLIWTFLWSDPVVREKIVKDFLRELRKGDVSVAVIRSIDLI